MISQDIQRGRDTIRFAAVSAKWRFAPGIRKNQKHEVARENETRENWGQEVEGTPISKYKYVPPDKRVPKKLSGGEKLDRDHETKMDLQERRIVMVISWHAVPHCPAEEQRWKTTQERRGRGGGNARGKTEASRHPIFSSHFTKSRSYFTIPLVAGTILVCAPFSIRHCTPKVSLSAALVFTKFVT